MLSPVLTTLRVIQVRQVTDLCLFFSIISSMTKGEKSRLVMFVYLLSKRSADISELPHPIISMRSVLFIVRLTCSCKLKENKGFIMGAEDSK